MWRSEKGQAMPLLAMTLVGLLISVALILALAGRVSDRATAQTAADAAALAGAAEGAHAARALAEANGAELITFDVLGDTVSVAVEVDGVRAEARAELFLRQPN